VNNLKEKISIIESDNLISYIIGQFIGHNLHNRSDINSQINNIKERHPDIIFYNPNEPDTSSFENSCKLFSNEEKNIFNQLIDSDFQEIVTQMKNYDSRIEKIKTELELFHKNCSKIAHELDIVGLKGECKMESHLSISHKFKKKLKSFKCYMLND
jgi:hypothetical protein